MSQAPPDPTRWLADLMSSEDAALWPIGPVADTAKALAAAAAPWTKAVADFTTWQLNALQRVAAPWTGALPGTGAMSAAEAEPVEARRFAGEEWSKDPRYDALVRTYLLQTE
jgi:polyhydroxyalkanoate synthase